MPQPPINRVCIVHLNSILDAADDVLYGADAVMKCAGILGADHADILLDTRDEMIRMLACLSDGHPQAPKGSYGAASEDALARMRFVEAQATEILKRIPGGNSKEVVGTIVARPREGSIEHYAECA